MRNVCLSHLGWERTWDVGSGPEAMDVTSDRPTPVRFLSSGRFVLGGHRDASFGRGPGRRGMSAAPGPRLQRYVSM